MTVSNKIWFVAICVMIILLAILPTAYGHSWYDKDCCHEKDCHKVIRIEKDEEKEFYVVQDERYGSKINNYEVRVPVELKDKLNKSRTSQDLDIHICYEIYFLNEEELVDIKCIYFPGAV